MRETAPYGSWRSPISAASAVAGAVRLSEVCVSGSDVYWLEARPAEKGRGVVARWRRGVTEDLTPEPFNVRTRVHEYGGGAYWVSGETVFFSNDSDGRIYRIDAGQEPVPITAEGPWRWTDGRLSADGANLYVVREDHGGEGEPVNSIALVDPQGEVRTAAAGADFYADPRLSADGRRICWLQWRHPNMPWDGTELMVTKLAADGLPQDAALVAGGQDESVFQPQWGPDGQLYFVSDRNGWWNLYRWDGRSIEPLHADEAEYGQPQWVFGQSTYDFAGDDRLICSFLRTDGWRLASIELDSLAYEEIPTPYTEISDVRATAEAVYFQGASPSEASGIVRVDLATKDVEVLRSAGRVYDEMQPFVSAPQTLEIPRDDGTPIHAYYYAPVHPHFESPAGDKPPVIVQVHGGPTARRSNTLDLRVQYWTSRGFGWLDVNYAGSSGYGRSYRRMLDRLWGEIDVSDCAAAAAYLAAQGLVDADKTIIRGGSAGGFTVLAALAFHDVFAAGSCHYGISDLEVMAKETHKFESRYLDRLIGKYPEEKAVYERRSPIHSVDKLTKPVLFLHGAEDKVVPPNQAEMMFHALRERGVPTAFVLFAGEQHGFRKSETAQRALESELLFFGTVLLDGPVCV
ncbi:MAG: prolyl oligopeptidase family serine peptidase [Acidobacteria bacterium]|nr:prolyl oligopeptidase family serine peptidase [Acidobacteriota bacterium]